MVNNADDPHFLNTVKYNIQPRSPPQLFVGQFSFLQLEILHHKLIIVFTLLKYAEDALFGGKLNSPSRLLKLP